MFLEHCTPEQLKQIYEDLHATEESIKNDVQYLIEWMDKQPHLPKIKDEDLLASFLLRGKNSIEKTKKIIDNYYTARAIMPDIFEDRDPCQKEIEDVYKFACYTPLPKLTRDGYRIVIFRIFESDNNTFPAPDNIMKATQIGLDISLKYDKFRGMTVIYDLENASMAFVTLLIPMLKKLFALGNKVTPTHYNKFYVLHLKPAFEPFIEFAKSLVKKELGERVVIWKKQPTDLAEVLPKDILPENYGGTERPLEVLRDLWCEQIKTHRDWLEAEKFIKADLSKKPYEENNEDSQYGLEGSFRKLGLD